MNELFRKFATTISAWSGSAPAFLLALCLVVVWMIFGAYRGFSPELLTWLNLTISIITFLMVFIIQYSSNREIKALNLKISELVVANKDVENDIAGLEKLTDKEIELVEKHIQDVIQNRTTGS